jgi:hypothetical protein
MQTTIKDFRHREVSVEGISLKVVGELVFQASQRMARFFLSIIGISGKMTFNGRAA